MSEERRIEGMLPWYVLPSFNNVILSFRAKALELDKDAITLRVHDILVTDTAGIVVPGAASFGVARGIEWERRLVSQEELRDKDSVLTRYDFEIIPTKGYVFGYLPNGKFIKMEPGSLKVGSIPVSVVGDYSKSDIDEIVRRYMRIEFGKLFAAATASIFKKNGGWYSLYMRGVIRAIDIRSRGVKTQVDLVTNIYSIHYGEESFLSPGIVPAVSYLMTKTDLGQRLLGSLHDKVVEALSEIKDVGRDVAPISEQFLQRAASMKFTYVIGRVRGKPVNKRKILAIGKVAPYTMAVAYAENNKIYMTVSIVPHHAPSAIVFNLSPLNIMPLSAVMNDENKWRMNYFKGEIEKQLRKTNIDYELFLDELKVLGEAGVTTKEIYDTIKYGYPSLKGIRTLLKKAENLVGISDILYFTVYSNIKRIDTIILEKLPVKHAAKKARKEEEEVIL